MNDSAALKSILLLAANPKGTVSLRLQEEEREIKERLRLAGYGKVPVNSTGATRTRDIQQAMLDFKPQIVHFTGHGTGKDGLAFEDGTGQLKLVDSDALASLFKLFSSRVECVVLNACYSESQAKAIAQHIDYVIGMNQAISDRAAIEFAVGFYTALGAGESIEFAYEIGCNAIQLEGISEQSTPILLEKEKIIREVERNKIRLPISSTSFFSQRFSKSFPGVRGIQTFSSPSEAIMRLTKLLEDLWTLRKDNSKENPIWWFRGYRCFRIESFEHLEDDVVLINEEELKIKSVIAVNAGNYYQCFVYIETYPMEPSGLYNRKKDEIQSFLEQRGYYYEEFGIYQRKFLVTRDEYDDGAATVDGKLIELDPRSTELRARYLSPYNLVIAAFDSPINNLSFETSFEEIINNILRGKASVEDLNRAVLELPKRPDR